jgi:hypothetical protein
MNPRACLFAALLVSPVLTPVFSQETAPAPAFDLRSDAIRQIIRETAATQFAAVRESDPAPAESKADEFVYIPPEPRAPVQEAKINLPEPPSGSDDFLSQVVSIVLEETLGIADADSVTTSNEILKCRVQKETRTGSSPAVDNCPIAD